MSNTYVYFNREKEMYGFSRRLESPPGHLSENNESLERLAGVMVMLESNLGLDGKPIFKEEFMLISEVPPSEYLEEIYISQLRPLNKREFREIMNALKALRSLNQHLKE